MRKVNEGVYEKAKLKYGRGWKCILLQCTRLEDKKFKDNAPLLQQMRGGKIIIKRDEEKKKKGKYSSFEVRKRGGGGGKFARLNETGINKPRNRLQTHREK